MRACPICEANTIFDRKPVFTMDYHIPDDWPLPDKITWYSCRRCGMVYGDGNFDQEMLDHYYTKYYGYGINSADNIERLRRDAEEIAMLNVDQIVDFGGAGDDGNSVLVDELRLYGVKHAECVGAGGRLPLDCNVIYASHVLEHIYNLPEIMRLFSIALARDGWLIIDGPDSTGLLGWGMPILDYNTKHINHFTLRNYLHMAFKYGFELESLNQYELSGAACFHMIFRRFSVAERSAEYITKNIEWRVDRLRTINYPVNVWGLSDITWHLLNRVALPVLDYIDNDPAFRGQTYMGKPVQERPTNDEPIVIMCQGQRKRLIENIRAMGIENRIIEI